MINDNVPTIKKPVNVQGFGLNPYRKSSILFLCDRTRCKNCSELCNHTSDITYAKNKTKVMKFEKLLGMYMEIEE